MFSCSNKTSNPPILFILVEVLLQSLVHGIIRTFCDETFKGFLVDLGVVILLNVILVGVSQVNDCLLKCNGSLFIWVRAGEAVSSIHLSPNVLLVNVDVCLHVLDGPVLVFLRKLIGLDLGPLKCMIGIGILTEGRR